MVASASLRPGSPAISSYFHIFVIYVFLISIACTYYLLNAAQIVGHYDLGWHLAAGDLIRDQDQVPFQILVVIHFRWQAMV